MSHDELTETELRFTGPPESPSTLLPILPTPLVTEILPLGPTQPISSSPSVTALPPLWIKVPQRIYDQGKKQWDFKASEPISFSVDGLPGINMRDALRKTCTGLDGLDDPVLQETAGAISCRLLVGLLRFSIGAAHQTVGTDPPPSSLGIRPTTVRTRYARQASHTTMYCSRGGRFMS